MLQSQQVEQIISLISLMDRPTLLQQFAHYQATFPIDFSVEFLDAQPLERLRHIFLAMCLQCQKVPDGEAAHAA